MTDVNDVKAGTYEVAALQFDQITSKPGEPFAYTRYRRGEAVTLDVAEARRLVLAGAVVEPGSREKAAAESARMAYEAALAQLPDALREQLAGQFATAATAAAEQGEPATGGEVPGPVVPAAFSTADVGTTDGVAPAGSTEAAPAADEQPTEGEQPAASVPERPVQVAPKALWIDYRVAQGMDRDKAEGATKVQLISAEPPTFDLIAE